MTSKQLRIGNYLVVPFKGEGLITASDTDNVPMGTVKDGTIQITAHYVDLLDQGRIADPFEPIPLSEEVLLGLGFAKTPKQGKEATLFIRNSVVLEFVNDLRYCLFVQFHGGRKKFITVISVHQLQNLMIELGEGELKFIEPETVKPETPVEALKKEITGKAEPVKEDTVKPEAQKEAVKEEPVKAEEKTVKSEVKEPITKEVESVPEVPKVKMNFQPTEAVKTEDPKEEAKPVTPAFIQLDSDIPASVNKVYVNICKSKSIPIVLTDTNESLKRKIEEHYAALPVPGAENLANPPANPPPPQPGSLGHLKANMPQQTGWHPDNTDIPRGKLTSAEILQDLDVFTSQGQEKTISQVKERLNSFGAVNYEVLKDGNQVNSIGFILEDGTRLPRKFFYKVKNG